MRTFWAEGSAVQLTPAIGSSRSSPEPTRTWETKSAWTATMHAAEQLDLQAKPWTMSLRRAHPRPWTRPRMAGPAHADPGRRSAGHLPVSCLLAYWALDRAGLDITSVAYLFVVAALAFTALAIWIECLAAYAHDGRRMLEADIRPRARSSPPICRTRRTRSWRRSRLPPTGLQPAAGDPRVQHPEDLPVEDALRALAVRDPGSFPCASTGARPRPRTSTQPLLVSAASSSASSTPTTTRRSFLRAWRWLSDGVDVVQGHCVVRNGDDGFVQKLVATEFEAIYAVAHPGAGARPRVRDLRRLERLLANLGAEGDEDAIVHAHGRHRLLDARPRRQRADRLDPGLVSTGARTGERPRPLGPASALAPGWSWWCRSIISGRACAAPGGASDSSGSRYLLG